MRKLLLLLAIACLAHAAHAENVMQFTGGNYVFAENGRLTFNVSPQIFQNRRWVYDPATDSAKTVFTLQMPLKTAHASAWHSYQAQNRPQPWGFQHAAGMRSHHYKYNPQYHQKTALPLIGYAVTVGGQVARAVLPGLVTRCLSNLRCASGVISTTGVLCSINFLVSYQVAVPSGICSRAESDGYSKNEQGEYVRNSTYQVNLSGDAASLYPEKSKTFNTLSEAQSWLEQQCQNAVGKQLGNPPLTLRIKYSRMMGHTGYECRLEGVNNRGQYQRDHSVVASIIANNRQEKLTMIDLENYIQDDFKQNPTPYINDKGQIGQGLRGVITLGQADIRAGSGGSDNGGTLSFYSSPYRNNNGDTVQDRVTIYPPQPHDSPKASGEAKDGASGEAGVSTTINNVKVENINRPDKESESQPGENNTANNGASGSSSSSGNGESGQEESGGNCKDNPDSVGCAKMGDVEDGGENPFSIPTVESGISWKPDNFLPSSGVCPQPKTVQFMGKTYEFSYQWLCEFATNLRGLFIGLAAIVAGFIVFRRG